MATFKRSTRPIPDKAVRVTLTANNSTLACVCGALRRCANMGKPNSPSYKGNPFLQPEAFASAAGCAAEIAVAQHLGKCWNARAWPEADHSKMRKMPDVGTNIEVKRIRDNKQYVEVKKKETSAATNDKRILWVVRSAAPSMKDDEHLEMDLLGWIECDQAWEKGEFTKRYDGRIDHESKTIPLEMLKPCTCLTGGPSLHGPEPILTDEFFTVPEQPLNNAGWDNPDCISQQSVASVTALFSAANTNNPTLALAPSA